MKHPGPWKAVVDVEAPDEILGICDANDVMVTRDVPLDGSMFTSTESARLILAAPELLEALKRVGRCHDCLDDDAAALALIDRIEQPGKDGE